LRARAPRRPTQRSSVRARAPDDEGPAGADADLWGQPDSSVFGPTRRRQAAWLVAGGGR
jgi:hypothetical protein